MLTGTGMAETRISTLLWDSKNETGSGTTPTGNDMSRRHEVSTFVTSMSIHSNAKHLRRASPRWRYIMGSAGVFSMQFEAMAVAFTFMPQTHCVLDYTQAVRQLGLSDAIPSDGTSAKSS